MDRDGIVYVIGLGLTVMGVAALSVGASVLATRAYANAIESGDDRSAGVWAFVASIFEPPKRGSNNG